MDKQTNNRVLTVRVSTTFGSHERALVKWTPGARGHITHGRAYTLPVLQSSSEVLYSSPLATHSLTMLGVRSLSAAGESSTSHSKNIWTGTQLRRNRARGVETALVTRVKALILSYILFVDLLPGPITLTSNVHGACLKTLNYIADAGNMKASEDNIKIVSRHRYTGMTPP